MFTAKRILVPVDFSRESELALEWAVMVANTEVESTIYLCHVIPRVHTAVGAEDDIAFDWVSTQREAAQNNLISWLKKIPTSIPRSSIIGQGRVAEEIARICEDRQIELVIMTTRGRSGLAHLLHGSSAEETVRVAPCPVLVLHLNQTALEAVGNIM